MKTDQGASRHIATLDADRDVVESCAEAIGASREAGRKAYVGELVQLDGRFPFVQDARAVRLLDEPGGGRATGGRMAL